MTRAGSNIRPSWHNWLWKTEFEYPFTLC